MEIPGQLSVAINTQHARRRELPRRSRGKTRFCKLRIIPYGGDFRKCLPMPRIGVHPGIETASVGTIIGGPVHSVRPDGGLRANAVAARHPSLSIQIGTRQGFAHVLQPAADMLFHGCDRNAKIGGNLSM